MIRQTLKTNMKLENKLEPAVILRSALLELPMLQLEERIKEELEENPFLESGDGIETDNGEELQKEKENEKNENEFIELVKTFSDYDNEYSDSYQDEGDEREYQQAYTRTLRDSLYEQVSETFLSETETDIATYIIDNLDEDGFFRVDIELVKSEFKKIPEKTIIRVLKNIQRFEPIGIASRDTRECLIVQLRSRDLYLEDTYIVLKDYYDDLFNKRYSTIMKRTGISKEQMQEIIEEIRSLNPKPGSSKITELWENSDEGNMSITPDFIVKEVDGKFEVILNNASVPNLFINKQFEQIYLSNNPKAGAKDYVKKKIESAKWFVSAVNQRRATLKKVMESIIKLQNDFFLFGPDRIKPMILKDVAEDIEMDIATISRAAKDKFVDTDFGIFDIKYFFTERSSKSDGEDISTRIIRERIREIITFEDKRKPLSDQFISDMLAEDGFTAARRTVQKYREELNYPPARLRKEL
ncbi:MAG: RNA polymerase factor sigma-54 [Candidatus Delongbacteria bacterium]|nr:RNA polymerase factor sigma-54 [Candidatus Delongbacteria bacterium]MCG2760400.1 RNA polymerase factor sigma-54 [Candidatus Delongbacteria bacterium]